MNTTSFSLLHQLKQPQANNESSWRRFVELYTPLLFQWSVRLNVPYDDRSDLVQNTFAKLLLSIYAYDQDTPGRFRGWLLAVLRNTWIDTQRKRKGLPVLATEMDPAISDPLEDTIDSEYRQYVLNRIRELVLRDFPRTTQLAFQLYENS
jgi:RNA polymerase sigma-70 factor, ECF subfamily